MNDEVAIDAVVQALYQLYDDTDSIEVSTSNFRAAILAHGWYMHVRQTGRALRHLADVGFEHQAAPLRRSMIEHALALHWLADATEDAVDALLASHQKRTSTLQAYMSDEWPISPGVFDSILSLEIPKSPESTYLAFKHLCQRYRQKNLYVAWLLETAHCHPSYISAAAYVEGEGSPENVQLLTSPPTAPASSGPVIAILLHLASQGLNRLLKDQPWSSRLEDLEREFEIAMSARRDPCT